MGKIDEEGISYIQEWMDGFRNSLNPGLFGVYDSVC